MLSFGENLLKSGNEAEKGPRQPTSGKLISLLAPGGEDFI